MRPPLRCRKPPPARHGGRGGPTLDAPACTAGALIGGDRSSAVHRPAAQLKRLRASEGPRRPRRHHRSPAGAGSPRGRPWALLHPPAGPQRAAWRRCRTHHGVAGSCGRPPAAGQACWSSHAAQTRSRAGRGRCMPPAPEHLRAELHRGCLAALPASAASHDGGPRSGMMPGAAQRLLPPAAVDAPLTRRHHLLPLCAHSGRLPCRTATHVP